MANVLIAYYSSANCPQGICVLYEFRRVVHNTYLHDYSILTDNFWKSFCKHERIFRIFHLEYNWG